MQGYPIINKETFYKFYSKDEYYYDNQAYRESDDSIMLFVNNILGSREMVFQLVTHEKNEVPEHRKNLYYLPIEDHNKLREELKEVMGRCASTANTKKISAQLLVKFVDPYLELNKFSDNKELIYDPFIKQCLEHLEDSKKYPERELMNLNLAKEMIEKRISYLKTNKQ